MKTDDQGLNRRNIPVAFMDYIAGTFGYDTFGDVPKKKLSEVTDTIKMRFSQTEAKIRRLYGKRTETIKRRAGETALEFAVRVDNRDPYPEVTETRITGTIPGDTIITGCPFDEALPSIPGDAEILSLSNLKPETVKQVAAELLEQEKATDNFKDLIHEIVAPIKEKHAFLPKQVIDPYATPIFDLKSFGKPFQNLDEVVKKWRETNSKIVDFFKEVLSDRVIISEIHDEVVCESVTDFAERFGNAMLKKKHAFLSVPETGPEKIISAQATNELLIETGQQWSTEELKRWSSGPGNIQNLRKPYFNPDLARPYRNTVESATSNDGINWADNSEQIKDYLMNHMPRVPCVKNPNITDTHQVKAEFREPLKVLSYTPENWPASAPPYHSAEGWEFEKAMSRRNLKSMLTITWLEKQQTEKHALIAQRLREILAA
jgi:hypothetical protein